MAKFVMLLILLGLTVAPANCRVPEKGDNVTIVVGFNQSFSGIIRDMPANFICIEDIVLSPTVDYCIGTETIQYLLWNDQQDILENKNAGSTTRGIEYQRPSSARIHAHMALIVGSKIEFLDSPARQPFTIEQFHTVGGQKLC